MDMLEESLLILPDLEQELAISIELTEFLAIDFEDNYHIIIGSIETIRTVLVLGGHSDTIPTLLMMKNLDYLKQLIRININSHFLQILLRAFWKMPAHQECLGWIICSMILAKNSMACLFFRFK
jgi:hypothetical protein